MNNSPDIVRFLIQLFCIATMAAMGLGITLDDVRAPFRNLLALVIIVVVNNLLVPLAGLLILAVPELLQGDLFAGVLEQIAPLTGGQQTGFLVLLLVSGNLLSPLLVSIAGASAPFAKGVMVVLTGASALVAPFVLPFVAGFTGVPGEVANIIDPGSVFMTLLLYQLLPLALGVIVKSRYDILAALLRPLIVQLAGLMFLVAMTTLVASGQSLIRLPERVLVKKELFSSEVLTSTEDLDASRAPDGLSAEFAANKVTYPDMARVEVLEAGKSWALVNADRTYAIISQTAFISNTTPISTLVISKTNAVSPMAIFVAAPQDIEALNARQISRALRDEFERRSVTLYAGMVVVIAESARWLFTEEGQTYYIENKEGVFVVSRDTPEPAGIFAEFLEALGALPDFGPLLDFLLQIVTIVIPFLLLIAVAALLLVIGHYGGVAVRGVVGVTGSVIPRTLALSTALRNVSMALILVSEHLVQWQPPGAAQADLSAIAVIFLFFVVSLAVAAHQAVQWRAEEATEELAAVGVVNEGAGRETPAFNPRLL